MGCIEFCGDGWAIDSMTSRCDSMTDGNFVDGVGCAATDNNDDAMMDVAGWCDTIPSDGMHETSLMMLTDGADCTANEMVCKTLHGGIFGADGVCAANGANSTTSSSSSSYSSFSTSTYASSSTGGADNKNYDGKCLLAPGAIFPAHQAGYSRGYTSTCPNTPGEGSLFLVLVLLLLLHVDIRVLVDRRCGRRELRRQVPTRAGRNRHRPSGRIFQEIHIDLPEYP